MSMETLPCATLAAVGGLVFFLLFYNKVFFHRNTTKLPLPPLPKVAGWPIIGNLLQLTEKKPHKTFLRWVEKYGPIYSIRTGASTVIVLNSAQLAKEAMVARYSSISKTKLSKSLTVLTDNKCMVATSDYGEFHKMAKRFLLSNVLGSNAQKQHRCHRDTLVENILRKFYDHSETYPREVVDFREIFQSELFGLALKQAIGSDVQSLYVDELRTTLSRDEVYGVLVLDPMEGAIDVDWRDFFPYLKWIPNKSFEMRIQRIYSRRQAVMNSLIEQQKKRIVSGERKNSYIDFLLSEGRSLTYNQMRMLLWEIIVQTSDTTVVATEWAIYELAKNPIYQDKLYLEIKGMCGSNKVTEECLPELPYLNAVFHESIRKYSPAPVVPLRYVHEDTQIGGYYVPAGSEIAVNIHGCNMDKNQWENPQEWNPERFLDGKYDPMDMHKTMAFGAGKRACAGSLQAMLIACTSIGRLVQEFKWRLPDGEPENIDTCGLTTRKLHPLHVIVEPRCL